MIDLVLIRLSHKTIIHMVWDSEKRRLLLRLGPAWKKSPGFIFDLTHLRRI